MKILVTGANGYIGQGVVKSLLDRGVTVVATDFILDNVDDRAIKKEGDIFSITDPYNYYDNPDVLLHLAWRNGFIHNSISHIEDLQSHYLFIKKVIDAGIKHVAVLGTMHEVGFFEGSINENTPTNPQSLYGIAKDAFRKIVFLLTSNANVTCQWIRGFYIVGNTEYGSSIFSKITKAEKESKELFPFTSGLNQWDFLDYNEFCEQVVLIVMQEKYSGIINACSGYPQKLSERVEKFILDNRFKIKLEYGAFPDRPYDSKAVWGDNKIITEIKLENENNEENL